MQTDNKMDNEYRALVGQDIEFIKDVEDLECYPETGMRATVLGYTAIHDNLGKLLVSYAKFDQYNAALEAHNYYDKNGEPRLTAREAGCYTETETIVVDEDPRFRICKPLEPEVSNILTEWSSSVADHQLSYSAWTTQQLIAARQQLAILTEKPEGERNTRLKP